MYKSIYNNLFVFFPRILGKNKNKEIQRCKNAYDKGNIEVYKYCKCKRYTIHFIFFIFNKRLNSKSNKREKSNSVKPHYVPVVRSYKSHRCVHHSKNNDSNVVSSKFPFKIECKERSRESNFKKYKKCKSFWHIFLRE